MNLTAQRFLHLRSGDGICGQGTASAVPHLREWDRICERGRKGWDHFCGLKPASTARERICGSWPSLPWATSAVSHLRSTNRRCIYHRSSNLHPFLKFSTSLEPRSIDVRGSRAPPEHTDKFKIMRRTYSNFRNTQNNAKSRNHPLKPNESNLWTSSS